MLYGFLPFLSPPPPLVVTLTAWATSSSESLGERTAAVGAKYRLALRRVRADTEAPGCDGGGRPGRLLARLLWRRRREETWTAASGGSGHVVESTYWSYCTANIGLSKINLFLFLLSNAADA